MPKSSTNITYGDAEIIPNRQALIDWFVSYGKPSSDWRIGSEHEQFLFIASNGRPLPYDGEVSIKALLLAFQQRGAYKPMLDGGNIVGLVSDNGSSLTLEPGGQFELSGAPLTNLHDTCYEISSYEKLLQDICTDLGIARLHCGFTPYWGRDDIDWMPKSRYQIMRHVMEETGSLGIDMMKRTTTIQANYDYADEADMARKLRLGLRLQPLATALFANSPFSDGKPNGYLSYRSHCWEDCDPSRCGIPDFILAADFGFAHWVDYALDVPMYFIVGGKGDYIPVQGQSFRDFLEGRIDDINGKPSYPTFADWRNHLSVIFTEIRLKNYIEMRGADSASGDMICALPALWAGLLYDDTALAAAEDICKDWDFAKLSSLRSAVPKQALHAEIDGHSLQDIAKEIIAIAQAGLRARAYPHTDYKDESKFLDILVEIADSGLTLAERSLAIFNDKGILPGNDIFKL